MGGVGGCSLGSPNAHVTKFSLCQYQALSHILHDVTDFIEHWAITKNCTQQMCISNSNCFTFVVNAVIKNGLQWLGVRKSIWPVKIE